MPFTQEQQNAVIKKVSPKLSVARICTGCGKNGGIWSIGSIVELREFNEGNLVIGGPITPLLTLSCNNCGNTLLLNAIQLGLVDPATGKLTI